MIQTFNKNCRTQSHKNSNLELELEVYQRLGSSYFIFFI